MVKAPLAPVNVARFPVLATICSAGSLCCRSKVILHCYPENSFCGSGKCSHSCTQISWHQPRLARLPPLLFVLLPAPVHSCGITWWTGLQRTIWREEWSHDHILSQPRPLVATQCLHTQFLAFSRQREQQLPLWSLA